MQPQSGDQGCSPLGQADELAWNTMWATIGSLQYTSMTRVSCSTHSHIWKNSTSVSLYILSSLSPPGSSLMEILEGRRRVSTKWTRGPTEDNRGGDLVRTWCRLMCHTLAEIVSLISEWQRLKDRRRMQRSWRGTLSRRMGDLVDIQTERHR